MLRRLLAVGLVVVSLAACGGSSPTESPSVAPSSSTPAPAASPSRAAAESAAPSRAPNTTALAACNGVALRADASTTAALVARISRGVKVRVVASQSGDAYTTGACGTAGEGWYKIDRVDGKKTKKLYGLPFVYAASGFFQ